MDKCAECGAIRGLKIGWNNCLYCSEMCERRGLIRLFESMPGAGPLPGNSLPHHIDREVSRRWEVDNG